MVNLGSLNCTVNDTQSDNQLERNSTMKIRPILAAFCVTVSILANTDVAAHGAHEIVKPNFVQPIPKLPGKSLVVVEVEYPPGASSLPHVHAKSAFIYAYVVSGAIESKLNDDDMHVY